MLLKTLFERLSYFWNHRFVQGVALLQVGTFINTFIQAAAGIVIARLLQPELFGIYTLAFSLASFLSAFVGIGIQDAVGSILGEAYGRRDGRAIKDVSAFLLKACLMIGLVLLLLFPFLSIVSGAFYDSRQIGTYAGIIMLASLFSTSFFSLATLGFQVIGRIGAMTALSVLDQVIRFGSSILFVFLGFGVLGGVNGHLAGALLVFLISLLMWSGMHRRDPIFPFLTETVRHIRRVALATYLRFSFWVTLDRNFAMLYMVLPVLMVGVFVSAAEVTFFKLAFGYINLVLSLLGPISVLLNVEFPRTKAVETAKLRSNFIKVSLYAMGASLVLTAGAIITAPFVFRFLYGVNFLPSVPLVAGFFVYGALFGIGVGLGPMWRAINEVRTSILINLTVLGIGIPLGVWLIRGFHIWGAVAMVTLWYTASHFTSFFYLAYRLRRIESISVNMVE